MPVDKFERAFLCAVLMKSGFGRTLPPIHLMIVYVYGMESIVKPMYAVVGMYHIKQRNNIITRRIIRILLLQILLLLIMMMKNKEG
jgi:hypothetical protein